MFPGEGEIMRDFTHDSESYGYSRMFGKWKEWAMGSEKMRYRVMWEIRNSLGDLRFLKLLMFTGDTGYSAISPHKSKAQNDLQTEVWKDEKVKALASSVQTPMSGVLCSMPDAILREYRWIRVHQGEQAQSKENPREFHFRKINTRNWEGFIGPLGATVFKYQECCNVKEGFTCASLLQKTELELVGWKV